MKFLERFTSERAFLKFPSVGRPALSGREFVSGWYRRPEKMQVAFYDGKGGKGTVEAEQNFFEFEKLSSMFVRYK